MHGTGIPGDDVAGATIKVNEDGSFNLLIGATDLGTGSDTVLAQMAAEVLGVGLDDFIVHSSDTDITPFDVGAYASSTTYVSGTAVVLAAEKVRERLREVAGELKGVDPEKLSFDHGLFVTPEGETVHVKEAALKSFYGERKQQISESASHLNMVIDIASAVDLGRAINPALAEGQITGSLAMGIGYALTEETQFSAQGKMVNSSMLDHKLPASIDLPDLKAFLVETVEPTGPFGVKSVGEIGVDNVAPAIANAIFNATGLRLRTLPMTPARVLGALREAGL